MDVSTLFHAYIEKNNLFQRNDKILLAVSGGKDSMLMLKLFFDFGIAIEVAHCNFHLRAEESDADQRVVEDYCKQIDVPIHVRHFDTKDYAINNKISIQMAARELRYHWFDQLAVQTSCDYIAIAQHKNDHVETVLLNLTRGTGLTGLQGIVPKRGKLIRPLLFLESKDIQSYVSQYAIPYRDDSSNFSTKYIRNKIRIDIVPQFEQLNANFIQTMSDNIDRFQEGNEILNDYIDSLRTKYIKQVNRKTWTVAIQSLSDKSIGILYMMFEPFGFSKAVMRDLSESFEKEPGRIFESSTHKILLDRENLILIKEEAEELEMKISIGETSLDWSNFQFIIGVSEDLSIGNDPFQVKLDFDKIIYPITVRSWREGDSFHPLGMKGRKKISDYFIGKKINIFEKRNTPIWLNGNGDIIWISGHQIDDRYKIRQNTQKVLTLVRRK